MAYFKLHAYDADVWLQEFRGLNQGDPGLVPDIRFAAEAENVETPGGVLQPNAGFTVMDGEFKNRIETLARFYRRWYTGEGSKDWMVCATGGFLYVKQSGSDEDWFQLKNMPYGVSAFQSNTWSFVSYEINEVNQEAPIDVLLMSNAEDGMIMVVPPDRRATWRDVAEQKWDNPNFETWRDDMEPRWVIRAIDTQGKKFGVIERYTERIWGGAIPDDPDMLMYSRPYDPTDWTIAGPDEEPEDGAGSIQQPSWDGDSFFSMKAFGDQLLAIKGDRIWRIMGTNPGEYSLKEQFGGGAPYPNTVFVDVERVIMVDDEGPASYDGMSVTPWNRDAIKNIWKNVNRDALHQMCAALFQNRYYLSIPIRGSDVNNALLVYNLNDGTILYYNDMCIESMLPTNDILYATSSTLPGRVLIIRYDSWEEGEASGSASRWVSPWMDLGYKQIQKGGFDFYFLPEVKDESVTLRISIETEKKRKTKLYTVNRTVNEHRYKRIHFGGTGRKFRIIIETDEGNTAPWRLVGGLQIVVETDPD